SAFVERDLHFAQERGAEERHADVDRARELLADGARRERGGGAREARVALDQGHRDRRREPREPIGDGGADHAGADDRDVDHLRAAASYTSRAATASSTACPSALKTTVAPAGGGGREPARISPSSA